MKSEGHTIKINRTTAATTISTTTTTTHDSRIRRHVTRHDLTITEDAYGDTNVTIKSILSETVAQQPPERSECQSFTVTPRYTTVSRILWTSDQLVT
jgi:hypothetical protein